MLQAIYKIVVQASFLKGLLVAVLLAVLAKIGEWLRDVILQTWRSRNSFDIAGVWMGECWLPSYQMRELEIWLYTRKGDDVKLKFFSYDPRSPKPRKWCGGGVYRGSKLSGYYYLLERNTYESGVMALEVKALELKGAYAQFDPKVGDEPLYVSKPNYQQRRIQLSLYARLKMRLGIPPFRTYAEVDKLFATIAASSIATSVPEGSATTK
jgi:hypothetical protein